MPVMARLRLPLLRLMPWALVALRALIAVGLSIDAADGQIGAWFVPGFLIAAASDIADGMIARRLGVTTRGLRLLDSCADGFLYLGVGWSLWRVHPEILRAFAAPLKLAVGTQLLSWLWCWLKFGQVTSYHSYLAKAWGLTLIWATVRCFAWGQGGWSLWLAIVVGIASHAEDLLMTCLLRQWAYDVPHLPAAWRRRTAAQHAGSSS